MNWRVWILLFIKNYFASLKRRTELSLPYGSLKIGLVADNLTQASLESECQVRHLTPNNYRKIFRQWKPDLLFVESAWQGIKETWKYKIASYPGHAERNNYLLHQMLSEARDVGIPAIFWNKEDNVHYDRFIDSAKLFEYVFTVDENCIPRYQSDVPSARVIQPLMFAVQPRFHHAGVATKKIGHSCFVGSYGAHIHPQRRQWQDLLFEVFSRFGLDVYDRNSSRKASHYRYPVFPGLTVRPKVPYSLTAQLYKSYRFNLNVNTIEASPTMFSRRLIEILAVGAVAVSTPSLAASRHFSECCSIVSSRQELEAIVQWSAAQYNEALERARYGAELVANHHTWMHRLEQIEASGCF